MSLLAMLKAAKRQVLIKAKLNAIFNKYHYMILCDDDAIVSFKNKLILIQHRMKPIYHIMIKKEKGGKKKKKEPD